MTIKTAMQFVLRFLGIKAFSKNESGQAMLQEAEKEKIAKTFGEKFATVFEKGLSEFKESDAVQNSASAQEPGGLGEEMMNALTEHQEIQLANQVANLAAKITALEGKNTSLQALVDSLSNDDETDPKAITNEFKGKEGVPTVMKVNMSKPHYAALAKFRQTGSASAYQGATIEVADLKTEFGTYLNTQRNLDILAQIFVGFSSSKYMTTVLAVTEYRATQALITSVVQQFTSEWTPTGRVKFKPLVIKNRRHKINFPIKPADVLDSYIFYLYDEGLSPDQMPITKYIIETLLKPQILQDIEMRMVFKGKYVEAEDVEENGPATPPEESMDGIETILVEAKAKEATADKSGINFFTPSAAFNMLTATDTQVLKFTEEFVDWISPLYATQEMNIFCSAEFYKRYKRAYKAVWGLNSGQDGDFGKDKIDFSNNTLVPLAGMFGSPILFATPKQNFVKLRYKNEAPNIINDIQKANYVVKIFGEFWLAVGFGVAEGVFAYVPNGYVPGTKLTAELGAADLFPGEVASDESGA